MLRYKNYMRVYMLSRYHKVRNDIINKLGGRCVSCGTTYKLEVDHVDNTLKTMTVERMCYVSESRRMLELKNCQLLCKNCHIIKSVTERGGVMAKGTHGTLSSYRYCKCDVCRKAKSDHNKRMGMKQK